MSRRFHAVFTIAASAVVIAAVAWGFVLVGSPTYRRQARFDEQRVRDLQTIAREIQTLVEQPDKKGTLKAPIPRNLDEAAKLVRGERINLVDPETREPYAYTVKNATTYELCATFVRARNEDSSVFWNHPAGRHCFTVNVLDPAPFW